MYVCGPTVYASSHVGHARPAVVFDVIRRYLEYSGLSVTFISNITDIDDKIINRSRELGISWQDLTRQYQDEYEQDMARLGVMSPSIRPRATEHIPEMLDLVGGLLTKGVAYQTPRGVWFDVSRFPAYGALSGRACDSEETEHRVEQDPDKRNPQDFALWKSAKPDEPSWPSPWGPGRPGWHIECSAMAGKYCQFQLDIHGGGADLVFPHHENELAQSEAFSGQPFVRHWLHNGFITVGSDASGENPEKMGKSKGNAFGLREAFLAASPGAIRLWILGTHYRMPLLYRPELLLQSEAALNRIINALLESERALGDGVKPASQSLPLTEIRSDFQAAMDDDFNTPQALAVVYELVNRLNTMLREHASATEIAACRNLLASFLGVLGLPRERQATGSGSADAFIDLLLALRQTARQEKNFPLSDRIRDSLKELGITIRDRGESTTWERDS
jgi:cysteinyl-tRNA synthetase